MPVDPADPLAPLGQLPGVADAVSSTRSAVDALLGHRVLRRRSSQVSAESALRGAWAASVSSGADIGLDALRAGELGDPVVQGALRVSAELGALADTWTLAPRQVLARLHVLAAADLVSEPGLLGRPSGGVDVAARIDLLCRTLIATKAPAVVVAAVVSGEILALDAFAPSSRVVASAAVRLTLVERGLDPKSLCVIEVGVLETREAWEEALAGYRSATAPGLAAWIVQVAQTVRLGAREATAICEAIQRG